MQDSSPAWTRLGDALVRRRIEMNPQYRNRRRFADERGIDIRIAADFEKARRSNFEPATITAIEVAYGLSAGTVGRFLQGAAYLEPQRAEPAPPEPQPEPEAPADTTADDMLAAVLRIAASHAEAEIQAEIDAHPEGAPAGEIFADEVEQAIWSQKTKEPAEKIRMLAQFRAVTRASGNRQVS
jgi:hypothetical protein